MYLRTKSDLMCLSHLTLTCVAQTTKFSLSPSPTIHVVLIVFQHFIRIQFEFIYNATKSAHMNGHYWKAYDCVIKNMMKWYPYDVKTLLIEARGQSDHHWPIQSSSWYLIRSDRSMSARRECTMHHRKSSTLFGSLYEKIKCFANKKPWSVYP